MDFCSFDEQLLTYDSTSTFDSAMSNMYLDDQNATWGASEVDAPAGEGWQPEATLETSIDPALLTSFDAPLDLLTEPTTFGSTATSLWDASPGSEWQPLESTESSVAPEFVNPLNVVADPLAVQSAFANGKIVFPSQSAESSAASTYAPLSPQVPQVSHQSLQWTKPPIPAATKPTKPPVPTATKPKPHPSRCPCHLCRGSKPPIPTATKPKGYLNGCPCTNCEDVSFPRKRKGPTEPTTSSVLSTGRAAKRKAKETTLEEDRGDSDSSLSSMPTTLDEESDAEDRALSDYEPARKRHKPSRNSASTMPTTSDEESDAEDRALSDYEPPRKRCKPNRRPAPKRRRAVRAAAKPENVPKGLEITMRRW
ncbi:MAG: hypothetical protein L6R39_000591 [Caloplaca ligustica]|nr:MAG: hypothetical protein L6R39_000591 [Caloplaca ligustica]